MSFGRGTLTIEWSVAYHPEWDDMPDAYVEHGVVASGRSRRLARAEHARCALKAYLGVQHYDPTRYGLAGEPQAKFFLSLFVHGRTVTLRTFPTLGAARAALAHFHASIEPW